MGTANVSLGRGEPDRRAGPEQQHAPDLHLGPQRAIGPFFSRGTGDYDCFLVDDRMLLSRAGTVEFVLAGPLWKWIELRLPEAVQA